MSLMISLTEATASISYPTSCFIGVSIDLEFGSATDDFGSTDRFANIENAAGSDFDDVVSGNDDGNLIDGRGGNDRMYGGAGNDTYLVDSAGDFVSELYPESGFDTVQSSISFSLADTWGPVEHLTLRGTGNINGSRTRPQQCDHRQRR